MEKSIKVRAFFNAPNAFGFYGNQRRYDGDEFTVTDPSHVSEKWMTVLEEPKKPGPKPKKTD